MHIQIVNFNLKNMSEEEFLKMCDEVAPAFASVPGLISKVWLADPAKNTYGGVYTWRDRHAMESYTRSDLFKAVATNPHLANLASTDFAVLEGPTRVTHGLVAVTV
jgi:quinol monooxygenase YgiN